MDSRAKLGIALVAWTNDDLPELGSDTTLESCISEARLARFSGVESGGKLHNTSEELGPVLKARDVRPVSGWYSGTVFDTEISVEKERASDQHNCRDLGAVLLVYGETAGTIQNRRHAPITTRRVLFDNEMAPYGRKLTRFADFRAEQGIPLSLDRHIGTAIQSQHDIDRVMAATCSSVGLHHYIGHLTFASADIIRVLDKHWPRINHVHAKDVRAAISAGLRHDRGLFLDAVLKDLHGPGRWHGRFRHGLQAASRARVSGLVHRRSRTGPSQGSSAGMRAHRTCSVDRGAHKGGLHHRGGRA